MALALLLALLQQPPPATVAAPRVLAAAEALDLAPEAAQVARAARARAAGAAGLLQAARAPRNPNLAVSGENLGAQREVTGRDGLAGIEGQAVLTQPVRLGGKVGAATAIAGAQRDSLEALARVDGLDALLRAVGAIAQAEHDAGFAEHGVEEARALTRLAEALARRAADGRAPGGEAARARIEA
ncbi:MAG: TolC family protein, partial [Gemmatimonadales bacterium]|nr:TolC family protein [Gemmatimonadales bacterium]